MMGKKKRVGNRGEHPNAECPSTSAAYEMPYSSSCVVNDMPWTDGSASRTELKRNYSGLYTYFSGLYTQTSLCFSHVNRKSLISHCKSLRSLKLLSPTYWSSLDRQNVTLQGIRQSRVQDQFTQCKFSVLASENWMETVQRIHAASPFSSTVLLAQNLNGSRSAFPQHLPSFDSPYIMVTRKSIVPMNNRPVRKGVGAVGMEHTGLFSFWKLFHEQQ
ncbi:unnamed protein product [Allacma fusca]|uniref:Uncharacterized protein n=1 Tax=Allacma fusca TaxID=39272 RepID=A0A8J2LRS2_9HEXA|nr:unnamed protein product [Allacma fusca]